ncbi:MAG: nucleotidyltransferase family protein [Alphaproteobacteria bacterium]|nr:nucleotidyltransferase family protein [Alphaproteobacteria bacterium]
MTEKTTLLSGTGMVLAAGMGVRMRPLTLEKPKPLLEVGGRTMLDHALDKLKADGINRAVVNAFYLADQIEAHRTTRRDMEIIIARETELLDTGGGIKNALPHFGGKPFFVLNADLPWLDGAEPSLRRMAEAWDPSRMDVLLLVMPTAKARGFGARGDFMMEPGGRLWRKGAPEPRSHVWISAQIMKPQLMDEIEERVFSNNRIFDAVEARGKLFGLEHAGTCYHAGTPEDLAESNRLLTSGEGWAVA